MAYQIGFADDHLHLHALFRRFIIGGGIVPENGAVANSGNTGNGEMTRIFGLNATVTETITVTLTSASAFTVTGSVTGALPGGTVGVAYTSTVVEFLLSAGTVAFVNTDSFTIDMVQNPLEASGDKWVIKDESAVEALSSELYLEAPGANGIGVAPLHYFGIDTPTSNPPYWRIVSSNEFNIGNTFYTQVGYSGASSPTLLLWEFKMKYWFIADANRFFVIVRVYDRYFVCSAGILQTYATEAQWGQPHYVAGCDYTSRHWSDYTGTIKNFPDPSSAGDGSFSAGMRVFRPDLLWQACSNWYTGGDGSMGSPNTADMIHIWPFGEKRIQTTIPNFSGSTLTLNMGSLWKWMMPGPEAAAPTYPLIPIQIYRREGASQAIYGTIPGVYMTTGGWMAGEISAAGVSGIDNPNRLANEDIITVGPDQYLCVPTVPYERRRGHWAAFKLE